MRLKMSSNKWRSFILGVNVFKYVLLNPSRQKYIDLFPCFEHSKCVNSLSARYALPSLTLCRLHKFNVTLFKLYDLLPQIIPPH